MSERYGLDYPGRAAARAHAWAEPTTVLACDPEGSVRFDLARHVLIEGDNREVLATLVPAYAGRVDAVYIDPPYNTGRDHVYRDRFSEDAGTYRRRAAGPDAEGARMSTLSSSDGRYHSAWLAMMEPRLRLAHRLLAEHGVLFCSIDDHEVAQLRLLLDDVFGADGFVAQIVVIGNRGGRDYLRIATMHEYVLVYGKRPDAPIRELPRLPGGRQHADERGGYELRDLRNRNPKFGPHNRPNLHYPIWVEPGPASPDGCVPITLSPGPGCTEVLPLNGTGQGSVWRWSSGKLARAIVAGDAERSEVVARPKAGGFSILEKHRKRTAKAKSVWDDADVRSERGTQDLRARLGSAVFDHPKPVELVARCLRLGLPPDGLVVDFFAGSGTTAEAVLALDAEDGGRRRCVLAQLAEPVAAGSGAHAEGYGNIADITRARLRAALVDHPEAGLRAFRMVPDPRPPWPRAPARGWDAAALRAAIEQHEHALAGAPIDPWALACAAGVELGARIERRTPDALVLAGPEGPVAVCTAARVDVTDLAALALAPGTRVVCRPGAPTDALALVLCRSGGLVPP